MKILPAVIAAALGGTMFAASPQTALGQNTIKIAYTDPLSGPFAQVGDANLKQMQYILDYINAKGGALGKKFELVPFDNKSQPSDALIALKSATDQNMPFIMQCSGSNIAAALIEAVDKHNSAQSREPHHLRQLRRGCDRADQREVQLLALPLRRQRRDEGRGHGARAAQGGHQGLPAEPGLPVRPVGAARRQGVPGQAAARRAGGRRRADPARQDQGLRALHHQDQGVRRAGADHRQLGPGHEPADQGRHRCRHRPALLHACTPISRAAPRRSARAATARSAR